MHSAYLIVICDRETNAVMGAQIWSSPEWEQSRCLPCPTYVAYQVGGCKSFHEAREHLVKVISDPRSRYHWLLDYLDKPREVKGGE